MFDRVIVSTDENPMFVQFVPIVSKAWKKYFPEVKLSIAFVTNRTYSDTFVKKMQKYGDVHIFHNIFGIPSPNQAKMVRYIVASECGDEVCMIEDMDTIPLQKKFFINKTSQRPQNHLLRVGTEVFVNTPYSDKMPGSTITAEGRVFKELINPKSLKYADLLNSWKYMKIRTLDNAQDINNPPTGIPYLMIPHFSDESLIQCLCKIWDPDEKRITKIRRDVDIHKDWVDRSWWNIDEEKLKADKYVCCNFLRPFNDNYERILPIVKHIFGEEFKKEDVILL